MSTLETQTNMAYKAISGFVSSLSEMFGEDNMNILLYNHLLSKTKPEHETSINKHIMIFREFCIVNRDAITAESIDDISDGKISYSEKVWIDLKHVFSLSDAATKRVMWTHILTISALVDPTGKAKQILKNKKDQSNETNFLSGFLDKVESKVDPKADPLSALNSVLSSGVLTDLIGEVGNGMKDGSLNMEKLMGSAQDIVSGITGKDVDIKKIMEPMANAEPGQPPDIGKMMSSIMGPESGELGKLMSGLMGGAGGADGAPPDIAKMMSGLMGGGADGAPPDMAKLMSGLMGGGADGAPPDMAKLMKQLENTKLDDTEKK